MVDDNVVTDFGNAVNASTGTGTKYVVIDNVYNNTIGTVDAGED